VVSTTGKIWMDRNLGATQVATSSTDAAAYGDLYQWGRAADGHQLRTSATTSTLATTSTPGHGDFIITTASPNNWLTTQEHTLWQGVSGTNNPCPTGYRLPTSTELENERLSWESNNTAGAFASVLKLTLGGYRNRSDGVINLEGITGYYWSSSVVTYTARGIGITSTNASINTNERAHALSVRCIKN